MSKKIYQQYEIGEERPAKGPAESVDVHVRRYDPNTIGVHRHKKGEIPRGMTAVQEEIWKLQNKKK